MGWFCRVTLCVLALKMFLGCPVSEDTINYVPSCPKTLIEWKRRAEFKKCSLIRQNCTSNPQDFVYHCVINNLADKTMEVCAEETHIIDFRCAEFNLKAEKIVESQTKKCEGFCPFKYNSTEAYKYQTCYPVRYQENPCGHEPNSSKSSSPKKKKDRDSNSNEQMIVAVSFTGPLSIVLLISNLFFIFKYMYRRNRKQGNRIKGKKRLEENEALMKYTDERKINKPKTNRRRGEESCNQVRNKESDPFILAIDIGEKYYGLAYTDPKNPQFITASHPMERIAVLIEKPNTIRKVGKDATDEFIEMKAEDIQNYVYVNEIRHDKLFEKVQDIDLQYIKLFTEATFGVIKKIEKESGAKMKDIKDVRIVFSAGCHWREPVKDLIEDVLKRTRASLNWEEGQEKIAFIEKVRTVSQFIREADAESYCLNFNVENLKIKSKKYAVLNVGFGSCHLTFLSYRDEHHFDIRDSGGTTRRDWKEALPEDQVWALCQEMIEKKYINQQNHVRVIHQYENLHGKIRMCRNDENTFAFSFPSYIFKKNFRKIAKTKGIEIQEKNDTIMILLTWYLMKTFFKELKEAVNDVIEKNKDEFEKLKIKCIFLIGGYSSMKMIQDAAKYKWFKNITVVIPEDGGVSYAVGGAAAGARGFIKFDSREYDDNH